MNDDQYLYRVRIIRDGTVVGVRNVTSHAITLGRDGECDITLGERSISRKHLHLQMQEDGSLAITDLCSSNGTFLNEEPISETVAGSDVTLRVGNTTYIQIEFGPGQGASEIPIADAPIAIPPAVPDQSPETEFPIAEAIPVTAPMPEGNLELEPHLPIAEAVPVATLAPVGYEPPEPDVPIAEAVPVTTPQPPQAEQAESAPPIAEAVPVTAPPIAGGDQSEVPIAEAVPVTTPPGAGVGQREAAPAAEPRLTQAEQPPPASPEIEPAPMILPDVGPESALRKATCPHCWHQFDVETILAVARHQDLTGDAILGPEAPQRFLPSRFTPDGHAVDARGMVCPELACPRCHLLIPQTILEKMPIFLPIIGAPASGKSYLLTAMVWQLRSSMPREFGFSFADADSSSNQIVNEYERTLFMTPDNQAYVTLVKTEMQGSMYDQVRFNNMTLNLPKPFMFALKPHSHHPWYSEKKNALTQTLVIYDNAGEHFEPGMDSPHNPGTQHLGRSHGLFFLFDPTKDPRFRTKCDSNDPQLKRGSVERQEILLTEAITRIKRYAASRREKTRDRPLVVIVAKYDIWKSLLKHPLSTPWRRLPNTATAVLDTDAIMVASLELRYLLMQLCPELVSTAESFSSKVVYVPVSALGHSPQLDPANPDAGPLLVRPKDVKPVWVTVPMLFMLARLGMIPALRRKTREDLPAAGGCHVSGNLVVLSVPGTGMRLEVPTSYLGRMIRCPETGRWFRLPTAEEINSSQGDTA